MILKEHELLQIDADFIFRLREQDPDALAGLSIKLVSDLKEVLERLNQNPTNSSRPSGSLGIKVLPTRKRKMMNRLLMKKKRFSQKQASTK